MIPREAFPTLFLRFLRLSQKNSVGVYVKIRALGDYRNRRLLGVVR